MSGVKVLVVAVITAMAVGTLPAEAEWSETRRYVGGPGPYTYVNVCAGSTLGVGVVCFGRTDAARVRVTIDDSTGSPIAAYIIFMDEQGNWDYMQSLCGASGWVDVPRRHSGMQVMLAGPVEALDWCVLEGEQGSAATAGVVRATYST